MDTALPEVMEEGNKAIRAPNTCTGDKNIVNISLETSASSERTRGRCSGSTVEADFLVSAAAIAVAQPPVV